MATSFIFTNQKGSKNLITYQGDLNYDGRVSMKDLAFLNAGALRQTFEEANEEGVQEVVKESVARDVDADFSNKIDLADLAILDQDWGKSLHVGDRQFTGSDDISWTQLDQQGTEGHWENASFKQQNEVESELGNFNQTLDVAGAPGVIGGDDETDSQTNNLLGTDFQDDLVIWRWHQLICWIYIQRQAISR